MMTEPMSPRYEFQRFLDAQEPLYGKVLTELGAGRKRSHWSWFVFPQIAGLGHSRVSRYYALDSVDEARGYLAHSVLGARLHECAGLLLAQDATDAAEILGQIDAMKLRSCMTLFHLAAPDDPLFRQVLNKFFAGKPDPLTLEITGAGNAGTAGTVPRLP